MTETILLVEKEQDIEKLLNTLSSTRKVLIVHKNKIDNFGNLKVNRLSNYTKQLGVDISKTSIDFLDDWADTPLDNGHNLKELLELTPPYSWWWFIDRWLHKTPHYKNSLVEIIETIETLNFMIDVEEPERIIAEDNGTLIGRVAEQVCLTRNIKFESIRKRKNLAGIFESVKPYLIESYLKAFKFEFRNLISRIVVPKKDKSRRSVMVVTYGDCWTTISYPDGTSKKGDRVSQQVIDELKKKRKIIGIDYDWTPSLGIKKMIEKRDFSEPVEKYFDSIAIKRTRERKKEIKRVWKQLRYDYTMKKTFSYKGVSLWPFMKNRIKFAFRKRLPSFAKDYETTQRAVEKLKPKVLFMTFEANALGRAVVMAAKENGVKVVAMQHGMIKENHPAYYHKKKDLENYPLPDKTAVYGKKDKQILTENSFYPKNKVVVTGSSRYDIFAEPEKIFNKEEVYEKLGIDKDKKLVVWATQPIQIDYAKKMPDAIFDAVKKNENLHLVVKLHPRDKLKTFYKKNAKERSMKIPIVGTEIDTNELLYASEFMLTSWSTTALEAMILDKPVITINPTGKPDPIPYAKSGAAIGVYNLNDVEKAINNILNNENIQEKLKKYRKEFVYQRIYKTDGKASDRVAHLVEKFAK